MSEVPSKIWRSWLRQLDFLKNIDDSEVRLHAGFGYYLGAPIEKDLWRAARWNEDPSDVGANDLITTYGNINAGIPNVYWIGEIDPRAPLFSIPAFKPSGEKVYVNGDIIRMQIEVANMVRLGLMGSQIIIEIGGGYGQLAAAILKSNPEVCYTIVDVPEVSNISERWLSTLDLPIEIRRNEHKIKSGCINILDNTWAEEIECDLMINTNSFCEMTESQVSAYTNGSVFRYNKLYSNNRRVQFQNKELNDLREIFERYGHVWSRKRHSLDQKRKEIIVLSREKFEPPSDIDLSFTEYGGGMPAI